MQRTHGNDLDELDDLQIVTRREYRRGYQAQVNGRLIRLRYRKIMKTADGQVLVHRPIAGEERPKHTLATFRRSLSTVLVVGWPFTAIALFVLIVFVARALR